MPGKNFGDCMRSQMDKGVSWQRAREICWFHLNKEEKKDVITKQVDQIGKLLNE